MYAGEIVEQAPVQDLFRDAQHPYTVNLLNCIPQRGARHTNSPLTTILGRVPSLTELPPGCAFAPRCHLADSTCTIQVPQLLSTQAQHLTRCFHWEQSTRDRALTIREEVKAPITQKKEELLQVHDLHVYYQQSRGFLHRSIIRVIDGVSFEVQQGRTLGVVGESGCGKSTIAGAVAGLKPITQGSVNFVGHDFTLPIKQRETAALRQLQMVFQNPDSSLNPRHTVEQILTRPLRCFQVVPRDQEAQRVTELLHMVNLDERYLRRKPRQLSGGEKQRVAIARAFAGNPLLVICDEPISSLDVSVQAAVINLLKNLQKQHNVALIFIAHDLNMVRYLSDDIMVLYLGKICEIGSAEKVFSFPYHPYTEALVSAMPVIAGGAEQEPIRLQGSVPSPANPPTGCRFHTRCPRKLGQVCETEAPPANTVDGKTIYCHISPDELRELQQSTVAATT
jgi:peptide/nickel transport system ATP-binding protein